MEDNVIDRDFTIEEINSTLAGIQGLPILGTLDIPMIACYCELANLEYELDGISDELRQRVTSDIMSVLASNATMTPPQLMAFIATHGLFRDEAEAERLFEKTAKWEELRATFWYGVRLTFQSWNSFLEIRSDFRVVLIGKKYNVA